MFIRFMHWLTSAPIDGPIHRGNAVPMQQQIGFSN